MSESALALPGSSKDFGEQLSKFGRAVVAVAGSNKPHIWLADRARYTPRGAQLMMTGKRKVSARALAAVVSELAG